MNTWTASLSLLETRKVKYKQLAVNPITNASETVLIFPGSKHESQHLILLALSASCLRLQSYSTSLALPASDSTEEAISSCNQPRSMAFWKLAERNNRTYPYAEMTFFTDDEYQITDFQQKLWWCLSVFDKNFKDNIGKIAGNTTIDHRPITFLQSLGFTKIKDSNIGNTQVYLVVLSCGDLQNEIARFPLRIEQGENVVFRVFFSRNDAVVTLNEGQMIDSAEVWVSKLNKSLEIGCFGVNSSTKQIHLTLGFDYKSISANDFNTKMKNSYDAIVAIYTKAAPILVEKYQNWMENDNIGEDLAQNSDYFPISDYYYQEDFDSILYDNEASLQSDLERIQKMAVCEGLKPYFHRETFPVRRLNNAILVRFDKDLVKLRDGRNQYQFDTILQELARIGEICKEIGSFPTLEMVHLTVNSEVRIVLARGIHGNAVNFLKELTEFAIETYNYRESPNFDIENSPYCYFFDHFSVSQGENFNIGRIADKSYYFWPISTEYFTQMWEMRFDSYISFAFRVNFLLHSILGFTIPTDSDIDKYDFLSEDVGYILEERKCGLFDGVLTRKSVISLLKTVQNMHSRGLFVGFICPMTIRIDAHSGNVSIAWNCFESRFIPLIWPIIPSDQRKYIAPEMKSSIIDHKTDLKSADLYSISMILSEFFGENGLSNELLEVLERGKAKIPTERPKIEEILDKFE